MMVEKQGWGTWLVHAILITGIALVCFPIYLTFVASSVTHDQVIQPPLPLIPGDLLVENYTRALLEGTGTPVITMLINSAIMALGIALGKIVISIISAYAIVYFRFRFRMFFFWAIFMTLMLPVEVRIVPTYEVVSSLGMLNSYTGLILPLIASATATFLFRQFFMTVPEELLEAARVDGATSFGIFRQITFPQLRPFLELGTLLGAIYLIQVYDHIDVVVGGQPAAKNLPFYIAQRSIGGGNVFGLASAYSIVVVIASIILANIGLRVLSNLLEDDS